MEKGQAQFQKCHLFMTNKSTTINQRSIGRKFNDQNVDEMSKSRRSKFTTNTKLTKSSLFKSISGFNVRNEKKVLKQLNLQIQLLQGSYYNLTHLTNHVKKQLSSSFDVLNQTLDQLLTTQRR